MINQVSVLTPFGLNDYSVSGAKIISVKDIDDDVDADGNEAMDPCSDIENIPLIRWMETSQVGALIGHIVLKKLKCIFYSLIHMHAKF